MSMSGSCSSGIADSASDRWSTQPSEPFETILSVMTSAILDLPIVSDQTRAEDGR